MLRCFTLYAEGSYRWLAFGQDPNRPAVAVDTNQVAICTEKATMVLDPGGVEVFPAVMSALVHELDMATVKHIFLSHQDPDVGSALSLWRQVCAPETQIHVPALWTSYLSHFDTEAKFTPIEDAGGEVTLAPQVILRFLPAHYLHSSACFCVYDPRAKILFSGDIGAALVPPGSATDFWVQDFAAHVPHMTGFHQRYLGSREARDAWVSMVMHLPIDMIVPQHGLGFRGPDVLRFLEWLSGLPIASGLDAYRKYRR